MTGGVGERSMVGYGDVRCEKREEIWDSGCSAWVGCLDLGDSHLIDLIWFGTEG